MILLTIDMHAGHRYDGPDMEMPIFVKRVSEDEAYAEFDRYSSLLLNNQMASFLQKASEYLVDCNKMDIYQSGNLIEGDKLLRLSYFDAASRGKEMYGFFVTLRAKRLVPLDVTITNLFKE